MNVRARIAGLGKYLPERVLTNADLEKLVDTSDSWIVERTGIRERRIAADHETAATMGIEAGKRAIAHAGIAPEEIDLVIGATMTPDGMMPSIASLIQEGIGARRAAAFDMNAVCVGFVVALSTASQFIASGTYKRVLIVGSEVFSRIIDWHDRNTCLLFGDGAGAVVLEASDRGGIGSFVLHSDGSGAQLLCAPGPCGPVGAAEPGRYFVEMDGPQIFKFAVQAMEAATREAVAAAGMTIDDIDLLVPHQANLRIINATARALRLPPERTMVNVERYGNTSSASIPIALQEAWEQGRLKEGDRVVLVAFGGGLAWGALTLEWAPVGPLPAPREAVEISAGGN